MGIGLRVVKVSFGRLWDEILGMIGANLVWFGVSLPLFAVLFLLLPRPWAILLTLVSVLAPNPLAGGLQMVANRVIQGEGVEIRLAWTGIRRNLRKTLVVLLIDCVVLAIILVNASFYLDSTNDLVRIIGYLWLGVLVLWMGLQMYLYPFLLTHPEKGSWQLFRDSFFLALANPGLTITVLAFVLIAISLSIVFGVAVPLLMMAIVALMENQAMAEITDKYIGRKVEQNGPTR